MNKDLWNCTEIVIYKLYKMWLALATRLYICCSVIQDKENILYLSSMQSYVDYLCTAGETQFLLRFSSDRLRMNFSRIILPVSGD